MRAHSCISNLVYQAQAQASCECRDENGERTISNIHLIINFLPLSLVLLECKLIVGTQTKTHCFHKGKEKRTPLFIFALQHKLRN